MGRWARKVVVLGWVLAGSVAGVTYTLLVAPTYRSHAEVLVRALGTRADPAKAGDALVMSTERELVSADAVIQAVKQQTGWPESIDSIRRRLGVTVLGDTQMLRISFVTRSPELARRGAQAFADSYLGYRAQQATARRDGIRAGLEATLGEIEGRTAQAARTLNGPAAGRASAAAAEMQAFLVAQAAPFRQSLAELGVVEVNGAGTVVEPAGPGKSVGSRPLIGAVAGSAAGFVAAAATAALGQRLTRRLRNRREVEEQLHAPVLAAVPANRRTRQRRGQLVSVEQPDSPAAEAYRALRAHIISLADHGRLQTVMVASLSHDDGTPAVAANFAVALARAGKRVVLVSANLRHPTLHRYFGLANDTGLSNVLSGERSAEEAMQPAPEVDGLDIIVSGPTPGQPAELIEAGAMRQLLAERSRQADFVVVDAPPTLDVAESLALAPMVDGVLVVIDARQANRQDITEVRHQLDLVGGRILGSVLYNLGTSRLSPLERLLATADSSPSSSRPS